MTDYAEREMAARQLRQGSEKLGRLILVLGEQVLRILQAEVVIHCVKPYVASGRTTRTTA